MKKIIAIILLILMLATLTACTTAKEDHPQLNDRFECMYDGGFVDNAGTLLYYRDTVTDIVYVRINTGMAVMLKADGTPYLWSELMEETTE